jgi:hypothetical protein
MIPAFGRLRQEDYKFKASLGYVVRLFQTKKKKKKKEKKIKRKKLTFLFSLSKSLRYLRLCFIWKF